MSLRVFALLQQRCGSRSAGWVFPSKHASSGHLTSIGRWFCQARRKAGLPEDLVLYCARHDFGTRVLMRTGNLAAVMRTMGHGDVKTAMQYSIQSSRLCVQLWTVTQQPTCGCSAKIYGTFCDTPQNHDLRK